MAIYTLDTNQSPIPRNHENVKSIFREVIPETADDPEGKNRAAKQVK